MVTIDELFDALIRDCRNPGDLVGENGLLKRLSRQTQERTIPAVMTEQPGYRICPMPDERR